MEHWIAGLLHTMRELTLFFAPNINSYKRYVEGSFAPTAVAWGMDNRTCALRVVGHGPGLRVENRVPGGDVNPYLATAAIIAGGLYGIENELELEPMFTGNAYSSDAPRVPATLRDAADLFAASTVATGCLRRRRRRALPEQRAHRAEGVRRRGHRLGAHPGVRAAVSAPKPVIGLTTYKQRAQTGVWDVTAAFLPAVYFEAVQRAGGIPILLPPQPVDDEVAGRVLDGLDGLIVTGGADVDPARYGQEAAPETDKPHLERDAWEDALLTGAIERELPFLGICRGMQVLNVNRGGTLLQHLPDVVGNDRFRIGNGEFATNEVVVEPGSELDALVGAKLPVKSYHHQGLDAVGVGLAGDRPHRRRHRAGRRARGRAVRSRGAVASRRGRRRRRPAVRGSRRRRALLRGGEGMSSTTIINPADETVITEVAHTSLEAVDAAVASAVTAQKKWAALAPVDRARALRRFAAAVDGAVEELARLEVRNSGHPIGSARWEAGHVRDVLDYYSGAPERLIGAQIPVAGGIDVTFHEPLGVVGVIVPWNFPMTIASWGFAPALAAGNAVLLKPADWTPLTAIRLGELALESGLPEHLFQVLPGRGSVVGERFVTHPDVRKIVFTGSTEVGKQVAAGCAAQVKPVTLELGGKSANIVFADSDLEKAAATAPGAVFDNAGQDCCARSRILVERSVLDRFLELLEPAVKAWKVGDPNDEATEMGPLVSSAHRSSVQGFLDDAPVAFSGTAPDGDGWWMAPTVLLPSRDGPGRDRRDLRPGCERAAVRRRSRRDRPRELVDLRPLGVDLDARPRPRHPRRPRRRKRQPVGELALLGALHDPVRRHEAERPRPRTRPRRPPAVHRNQERLLQHRIGAPMDLTQRLKDRVAVITGGASGIGLATARRFAAEGARVVIGDLDPATGEKAAAEVNGLFVPVNVADKEQVDNLFDSAAKEYGSVDIAFNNAGISPPDDDSIETTELDAWDKVQLVNLTSVYLCSRAALRHMVPAGRGSIINTASFVAILGSATSQISYTASKGGVLAMTRELGVQFARQGIRVNALCPGPVNTPLLKELFAKDPERAARRLIHVPVGRFAEPEELAAAVAFLASDDASFITASTFLVDGGISAAYVTPL